MDKILVSFYVIKLDEEYDMYLPINEKISSVINNVQNTLIELSNGAYVYNENAIIYDGLLGRVVNNKNIVKFSGLKNGSRVLLI